MAQPMIHGRGTGRPAEEPARPGVPRQFVNFAFYQVDPAWRRLPRDERQRGKDEFASVVEEYAGKGVMVYSYSTVGLRKDADLVLWRITTAMDPLQEMSSRLLATGLGQWLSTPHSFLAMTKRSLYVDKISPEHEHSRAYIVPARARYLFIYPFVKKRDWYMLSKHARQGIMDEHIEIGNRYPSVKLNTTYSFGLDDQEFVVAFETDSPADFLDLVQELRETESSRYTERDTPIFTCVRMDLRGALDALGG